MDNDRIAIILIRLRRFLEKHEVRYWLSAIKELLDQFAAQPEILRGKVREILGHGMSGLIDLAISKMNGHRVEREREANFELFSLFEVLITDVKHAADFDKGAIKHFMTYPSTNAEWEVELTSGDLETVFDVLLWITYYHSDWRWVQEWCLYFTYHSNQDVRGLAARCLADIARLH